MKLNEIVLGDMITIHAFTEGEAAELKAYYKPLEDSVRMKLAAAAKNDNFVPIEMVKAPDKNNTEVLFTDIDCDLEVLVYHEEQLYKFDHVIIPRATLSEKETIQLIISDTDGLKFNRRNAYRVPVGVRGELTIDGNQYPITVRDISRLGVGMIVPVTLEVTPGQDMKVSFEDATGAFDLPIKAVRQQDFGANNKIIGAIINPAYQDPVEKYVAKKQVENSINSPKKEGPAKEEPKENINTTEE